MLREKRSRLFGAALAIGLAVGVGGRPAAVSAATATTTTTRPRSTTTTTTLPPKSSFSPATAKCMKLALAEERVCKLSAATVGCKAQYQTAITNCFAAGQGIACAQSCETTKATCETAPLGTVKLCVVSCKGAELTAVAACAAQPTCIASAKATFLSCKKACNVSPSIVKCKTDFATCLTKCPNL